MDYEITSASPDGIRVKVEFWVETWDSIPTLMKRLHQIDAEV